MLFIVEENAQQKKHFVRLLSDYFVTSAEEHSS